MSSRFDVARRSLIRLAILIVLIVGMSVAGSASAFAQETAAASCSGDRTHYVTNGDSNARIAQTFVSSRSGNLTKAELDWDENFSSGDYLVEILAVDESGKPTYTVLAATTVAEMPHGPGTMVATFATPASVEASGEYALAVSRSGARSLGWGAETDPSTCQGGMFYELSGAWYHLSGLTWAPDGADAFFTVFVTPPPPPPPDPEPEPQPEPQPEPEPQPQAKADGTLTIDANKGKVEKGRKVLLSGQLDIASNESCEQNRQIQIQRRLKSEDDSKFATFATVNTDATGNYMLKAKVTKTYFYRAVVAETDVCDDETSSSQKVRVQKNKAAQEA